MEYISAEEFKKQTKEIQQDLVNWWKANESETDLVCLFLHDGNEIRLNSVKIQKCNLNPISEIIPLLTEGQLRKFIQDNAQCKLNLVQSLSLPVEIWLFNKERNIKRISSIDKFDVLQAYWKSALEIAKEKVERCKE